MNAVTSIDDSWKVVDEWWRGAGQMIARMYFTLVLENGQRVTVFQDLANGGWYRQAG
ncbi:MAG: hypothetical protein HY682_11550 [Chloroflexi bacterium]|nr:hypothetical protein [Chloroflexota bacterium]